MAELLRQRLGEVGIGVKVISVDGKTRDSRVRAADYQLAILGHGAGAAIRITCACALPVAPRDRTRRPPIPASSDSTRRCCWIC